LIGLNGKTSPEIGRQYNVSSALGRLWAKSNNVPYIGTENRIEYYVFDKEMEEQFRNRSKTPEPRPRKEKPIDAGPKRPVGRPRKNLSADIIKSYGKRRRLHKEFT
jgi:hypothetical protein